jgi:hypothetical protein
MQYALPIQLGLQRPFSLLPPWLPANQGQKNIRRWLRHNHFFQHPSMYGEHQQSLGLNNSDIQGVLVPDLIPRYPAPQTRSIYRIFTSRSHPTGIFTSRSHPTGIFTSRSHPTGKVGIDDSEQNGLDSLPAFRGPPQSTWSSALSSANGSCIQWGY